MFDPSSPEEIEHVVSNLRETSAGWDDILGRVHMLMAIKPSISIHLSLIVNLFFSEWYFFLKHLRMPWQFQFIWANLGAILSILDQYIMYLLPFPRFLRENLIIPDCNLTCLLLIHYIGTILFQSSYSIYDTHTQCYYQCLGK